MDHAIARFSGLALAGIVTVSYFIAGKLGLSLASFNASASPLATRWNRAGRITLLGYRVWPAILVGAFLVNVTTAGNVATSFTIAAGNTSESVAGAWLVNRFAAGKNVFDRPQGVFKLAVAAAISTRSAPSLVSLVLPSPALHIGQTTA